MLLIFSNCTGLKWHLYKVSLWWKCELLLFHCWVSPWIHFQRQAPVLAPKGALPGTVLMLCRELILQRIWRKDLLVNLSGNLYVFVICYQLKETNQITSSWLVSPCNGVNRKVVLNAYLIKYSIKLFSKLNKAVYSFLISDLYFSKQNIIYSIHIYIKIDIV